MSDYATAESWEPAVPDQFEWADEQDQEDEQ